MSDKLMHLRTAWDVDRNIVLETNKLIAIRFSSNERLKYKQSPTATTTGGDKSSKLTENPPLATKRVRADQNAGKDDDNEGDDESAAAKKARRDENSSSSRAANTELLNYDHNVATQRVDEMLAAVAPVVVKYCTIYAVDTDAVPGFNELYELHDTQDPFAVMFFFQNKHVKVDLGTGNNNKINFLLSTTNELVEIMERCVIAGKEKSWFVADVPRKYPNAKSKRDL